jgi:phosphoribosylformylglycinamidine cyclo-ligase
MYNPVKPFKKQTLKLIEGTWNTPYIRVQRGLYPLIKARFSYPEVDHTDGIGTKGFYHWKAGTFRAAVLDALAMNLNDLAMVGAVPYKMSNHITVPVEDRRVYEILQAMARECRKRKIAMVGGETSFHDNLQGMDISMTVSGFVKKPRENQARVGDVLIGLPSSGVHSNGITKLRALFGTKVRKELTVPTRIYLDDILRVLAKHRVHAMMHITGGAFTKLKDIVHRADAVISKAPSRLPPIFREIHKKGVSNKDMYSTFNCGVGFVLSVPRPEAAAILKMLKGSFVLGEVVRGSGTVRITSAFDGKAVVL